MGCIRRLGKVAVGSAGQFDVREKRDPLSSQNKVRCSKEWQGDQAHWLDGETCWEKRMQAASAVFDGRKQRVSFSIASSPNLRIYKGYLWITVVDAAGSTGQFDGNE